MEYQSADEFRILERIEGLTDFLRGRQFSLDGLMDHLLVDTFYGTSAFGHILHIVRSDGSLGMPAKSGFKSWPIGKFPERFVTTDTPLHRSLRTGEVVECGSFETFSFAGPDYLQELFPQGFAASVAWPVPGVGSVITFFKDDFVLSARNRLFLQIVGKMISIGYSESKYSNQLHRETLADHTISGFTLTARQWNILAAIRRGRTNPEIAQDFDFSESLVRHETMRIYQKLAVSGRKELIDMPDEKFPLHLA